MTRTRILTTASAIYLAIAMVLFLTFLFGQPSTAAKAMLGFTSTPAATPVEPPPTLAPPTSTLEPVATSTPGPTSPPAAPTSPPSNPQATPVPATPTAAIILPVSGGGAGQSGAIFWVGGGAALLFGWLLHYQKQAHKDAQT